MKGGSWDPLIISAIQRLLPALHGWFSRAARDLPWRRTSDPYAIWVSEVMLQQTQVAGVIPYFQRWMAAFPDVAALARADLEDVLKLWEGLGYYSRARNLHRAARALLQEHGGKVPSSPEAFRRLPGVGPYTVAAVMSLAFKEDLAVVDGNVRRVLCRLTALDEDPRRAPWPRALQDLASELLPPGSAPIHNQAMMELGALVCTPRSPLCPDCPLRPPCQGRQRGKPEDYPVRAPRKKPPHHTVSIGLVFLQGRVFIGQRPYDGLLGGLWEFPGGKVEPGEAVEAALARELMEEFGMRVKVMAELPRVRHAYSHFKVTLHPYVCALDAFKPVAGEGRPWRWIDPEDLEEVAMPRANRKVLEHLSRYLKEDQAKSRSTVMGQWSDP